MNTASESTLIDFQLFSRVEMRVGSIVRAEEFSEARKPAYKLYIDFGSEIGIKQSSAQITVHYSTDQLIGQQVIAVVNFPPKRIAGFVSEVLTLGVDDDDGDVILLQPQQALSNGQRVY